MRIIRSPLILTDTEVESNQNNWGGYIGFGWLGELINAHGRIGYIINGGSERGAIDRGARSGHRCPAPPDPPRPHPPQGRVLLRSVRNRHRGDCGEAGGGAGGPKDCRAAEAQEDPSHFPLEEQVGMFWET